MSNEKHTQGRLTAQCFMLSDELGRMIAHLGVSSDRKVPPEELEANARRLVACWNACDGVSTDWLEGRSDAMRPDAIPLDAALETAIGERDVLWRQRDELLAALVSSRRELFYCAQQLQTSGWNIGSTIKDAITSADAAIAKVKGDAA